MLPFSAHIARRRRGKRVAARRMRRSVGTASGPSRAPARGTQLPRRGRRARAGCASYRRGGRTGSGR